MEARLGATYTDSQYGDVANTELIELDVYTVVDGSVSFKMDGDKNHLSFYGKNLTDEEHTNFAVGGFNSLWAIAPPRTFGVELFYNF